MTHPTRPFTTLDPGSLRLPAEPKVVDIRMEPYVDTIGDSELRVWVILDDATTPEQRSLETEWKITTAIRDALSQAGERRHKYVRFLTQSQLEDEPDARWVR